MLPVVAIVGRPNVGKSTLFNRLTKRRDALVADLSGLTRDRQYGTATYFDREFIVIDTGGIGEVEDDIDHLMSQQTEQALVEADIILFLLDAKAGVTGSDEVIANKLRALSKPVLTIANKIDGLDVDVALADFYSLGLGDITPIAAAHNRGVTQLQETLFNYFSEHPEEDEDAALSGVQLAIVGRPNVGKSTLVNRMLGEERVVVFDMPGTTRDSIFIPMERRGQRFTLIDTAGVRRKSKVDRGVEKFSVIKTLQAIEKSNVVIMVFDARENITEQDMHLLGFILEAGRSLVLAINKWDGMEQDAKDFIKKELDRRLGFVSFAEHYFISAKHGTGVGELFDAVTTAYQSAIKEISTADVSTILERAVEAHPPSMVQGRRIKLRYAHLGGHNPPTFIIHGNQTQSVPVQYKRYLMNYFTKAFQLVGTPVKLVFKTGENPFRNKKNILTDRQKNKRKRLMKHIKKRK